MLSVKGLLRSDHVRGTLLVCLVLLVFVSAKPGGENDIQESNGSIQYTPVATRSELPFDLEPRKKLRCEDVHHAQDKCAFVQEHCDDVDTGFLSYLDLYYCKMYSVTPIYWTLMAVWLFTLFASIGVSASDFLTINLAVLSTKLHLPSTVAGVTLLALGNGSPDLFSTWSAISTHSGSLAIGELIGAAGFITTVVAAVTAWPRPFKVKKYAFMRDIICFGIAVAFSLYFLIDGHLTFWECGVMVVGYIMYVILVLTWHLIMERVKRKRARKARAREHFTDSEVHERAREPSPVAMGDMDAGVATGDEPLSIFQQIAAEEEEDEETAQSREVKWTEMAAINNQMRAVHRHRRGMSNLAFAGQPIRPSLLGAAEFGSVLSSLERRRSASTRSNSPQRRRSAHLLGAQNWSGSGNATLHADNRRPPQRAASDLSSTLRPERTTGARPRAVSAAATHGISQHPMRTPAVAAAIHLEHPTDPTPQGSQDSTTNANNAVSNGRPNLQQLQIPAIPSISVSDEMGQQSAVTGDDDSTLVFPRYTDDPDVVITASPGSATPVEAPLMTTTGSRRRDKIMAFLSHIREILFPQFGNWKEKTHLNRFLAIITVPIIIGLTLTVPIGETVIRVKPESKTSSDSAEPAKNRADGNNAIRFDPQPEIAHSPSLLSPASEADDPLAQQGMPGDEDTWNPYLMSAQILIAPIFFFVVVYKGWLQIDETGTDMVIWCCSLAGASLLLLIPFWYYNTPKEPPPWQSWLSVPGFLISIGWISIIAGEVVGVLKTFQLISGFSEAILGLIVFAAGNSVSDMFANLNTARAGKSAMAFHACFGGPNLNILLGVGIGGIGHILARKHNRGKFPAADESFSIEVGRTLIVSGAGLLITLSILLFSVYRNHWVMDKKIGRLMIGLWVVITTVNVLLEILQLTGKIKPW